MGVGRNADWIIEGQVQPFWLDTVDGEKLFCWHVLPLDVYLENENELVQAVNSGEVVDGLEGTVGAKLLKRDVESRVVVNFHGVSYFLQCFVSLLLILASFLHIFCNVYVNPFPYIRSHYFHFFIISSIPT